MSDMTLGLLLGWIAGFGVGVWAAYEFFYKRWRDEIAYLLARQRALEAETQSVLINLAKAKSRD